MFYKKIKFRVLSWILILTFVSGYLNVTTLLKYSMTTTHFTGNISGISLSLLGEGNRDITMILLTISVFFLGGVLSGVLFYDKNVGFSKRFGIMTMLNGVFYCIINTFLSGEFYLVLSTAFIAGIQNAFVTRYRGIVTRTTHLTGYLTDCAIHLGRIIRGDRHSFRNFIFFLLNILFFLFGGICSILMNRHLMEYGILMPSIFLMAAGIYYLLLINHKDIHQSVLKNK